MTAGIHDDCLHFNGYKPCRPHKETGVHCDGCPSYRRADLRILVLKVGLAGEVLRCTPLLRRIRALHPLAEITWVTSFPDFVPTSHVDRVLKHSWETSLRLLAEDFDLLLSLDKDFEVCALAGRISAREKRGFGLNRSGRIVPLDARAEAKWATGVLDDRMKANTKHYVREMFELCGWEWQDEKYILEGFPRNFAKPAGAPLIGLNTGASDVWRTRLWPDAHWAALIRAIQAKGWHPLLLGGPAEDGRNRALAAGTGARYEGVRPPKEFFGLVETTDVVVTAVTMAMHVAIALGKPVVLFNNIFNGHEFHLYGRGVRLEPGLPCQACYKPRFDDRCPVKDCMELIAPERVVDAVEAWLPGREGRP